MLRLFVALLVFMQCLNVCAVEPKAKDLNTFKSNVKTYSKKRGLQLLEGMNETALMWQREDMRDTSNARPRAARTIQINKSVKETADKVDAVRKGELFLIPPLEPKVGAIGKLPSTMFTIVNKRSDTEAVVELPIVIERPPSMGDTKIRRYVHACFKGFDFSRQPDGSEMGLSDRWVYISGTEGAGAKRLLVYEALDIPAQEEEFFDKMTTVTPLGRP